MHRKHTSESHKAAIFDAPVVRETLVFQPRRISTRAKKRPFVQLSSLFAQLDRVGRAKWFTRNDLAFEPPAQQASKIQAPRAPLCCNHTCQGMGSTNLRDYAAIGFYNTAPNNTDYPGTGSLNSGVTQIQRLGLGAFNGNAESQTVYNARIVGETAGDAGNGSWFFNRSCAFSRLAQGYCQRRSRAGRWHQCCRKMAEPACPFAPACDTR